MLCQRKEKKGCTKEIVPFLFTDNVCRSICYLIKYHEVLGIHPTKEYLFAAGDVYLKDWNTL